MDLSPYVLFTVQAFAELSDADLTDLMMIRGQLEATIWYNEVFRAYEWNPSKFNVGSDFGIILNGKYAPLDERLLALSAKMQKVDAYYDAARANISDPTLEHTELAISQNEGTLRVFGPALIDSVHASGLKDADKQNLLANIEIILGQP